MKKLRWIPNRRQWRGAGIIIEWRPRLQVWDAVRRCDSPAPVWNMVAVMATSPMLRTPDFFEACCFVLGNRQFPGRHLALSS